MGVVSGGSLRRSRLSLRQALEPLAFVAAAAGVVGIGYVALLAIPIQDDPNVARLLMAGSGVVVTASLACLAFAAGRRRSVIDLAAVIAGYLAVEVILWGPWLA